MKRTSREPSRHCRDQATRYRPRIEGLEGRQLLSAIYPLSSSEAGGLQSFQQSLNSGTPWLSGVQPLVQVTPTLSLNPINITYGTALANSQITGTATDNSGPNPVTVPGTYAFTTASGTILGAGSGQSESVTFTPTDTTNYTTATSPVVVNVAKATPTLSINPVNIDVGVALDNSQLVGSALWTVNGTPVTVLGSFIYTTANGTVLPKGAGQIEAVTFTPTDTTDYNNASGTVVVNVGPTPTVQLNPVNITYGTLLDNSQLVGTASYTSGGTTVPVPGIFTYTSAAGRLLNAGTGQIENVTFTPTDTSTYNIVTSTVSVNVAKATPSIIINPVNIPSGTVLNNSQLSGTASYVVAGKSVAVPGSFSYTTAAGTVLPVGAGQNEAVTFTPTDTTDYNVTIGTVVINVISFNASSSTVIVGTNLALITGQAASDALRPTGTVVANFNGALYSSTIRGDGSFALLVPTANLVPGTYIANLLYSSTTGVVSEIGTTATTVTLGVTSLLNNNHVYSQGSVIPISIMTVDVRNQPYRSKQRIVTALAIAPASDPSAILPLPAGSPASGRFHGNRAGYQFFYGLRTRQLAPGAYILYVGTNDDPLPHAIRFVIGRRASVHRLIHHRTISHA